MIQIKRLHEDATIPFAATAGSAGLDLTMIDNDIYIGSHERVLVSTGLAIAINKGYVGMVCPRSGLALKKGITVLNAPGIIDSDYRGELKVMLYNSSSVAVKINKGDRIAQLILTTCVTHVREVDELDETVRSTGGFGSTGVGQFLTKEMVDSYSVLGSK